MRIVPIAPMRIANTPKTANGGRAAPGAAETGGTMRRGSTPRARRPRRPERPEVLGRREWRVPVGRCRRSPASWVAAGGCSGRGSVGFVAPSWGTARAEAPDRRVGAAWTRRASARPLGPRGTSASSLVFGAVLAGVGELLGVDRPVRAGGLAIPARALPLGFERLEVRAVVRGGARGAPVPSDPAGGARPGTAGPGTRPTGPGRTGTASRGAAVGPLGRSRTAAVRPVVPAPFAPAFPLVLAFPVVPAEPVRPAGPADPPADGRVRPPRPAASRVARARSVSASEARVGRPPAGLGRGFLPSRNAAGPSVSAS